MCLSPPDSRPEHVLIYCPGPTFLYKVWGGTRFICKRRLKLWSSGPSWNTFSSRLRFEQANVKKFQLHNMGKEAERYVGVVSLSPPFYRNLATRCLGYILGTPHVQVMRFDRKAVGEICSNLQYSKVWNTQIFLTSLHYCRPVAPLSILWTYCESCFVSV
jgi:hypothetical protein